MAADARRAGIRGIAAPRIRQRLARAPVCARPRRVPDRRVVRRTGRPKRFELDGATGHVSARARATNSSARAGSASIATASSFRSNARLDARRAVARRRWPPSILMRQGLAIVARNFRTRFGEIDLIARDGACWCSSRCACAARRRSAARSRASPRAKRARLVAAANGYLAMLGREPPCRFDAILMRRARSAHDRMAARHRRASTRSERAGC